MKFAALLALAAAEDLTLLDMTQELVGAAAAPGAMCTTTADCGDAATMCCGIASNGTLPDGTGATVAAPNAQLCQTTNETAKADLTWTMTIAGAGGDETLTVTYPAAAFFCNSGASKLCRRCRTPRC